MASDLIFCDWEHGTVNYILHTDSVMENFPHWSPDGKRLYYTAAKVPEMAELDMEGRDVYSTEHYRELRYDVMYMDFDEQNQTFSIPHLLVDCAKNEKSASVPRVSPDGRYVLYTLGNYGQFHIWHKSADLWVHDLKNGTDYPLEAANSHDVESYHTWSSNGRWIAFSSKRDDGDYTRVYIAYFDNEGKPRKALMLPQEDPEENILLLKSYNVPELTREAVHVSRKDFENAVYKQPACKVKFESVDFNKKFNSFSSDDTFAFYLMTPQVQLSLLEFDEVVDSKIVFVFDQNKLYVFMNNYSTSAKISVFRKIDVSIIKNYILELSIPLKLIDDFDVDKNKFLDRNLK